MLLLSVPDAWKETLENGGDAPTLTITYSDPKSAGWIFLVSVLSKPVNPGARFDAEFVREVVVANGKKLLEGSVESELDVKDLAGPGVTGYYYHLTDRKTQLQPDDYRYMTQGMASLGSIALTFTLLSNSRDPHVLEQALDAVKGATTREK